MKNMIAFGPVPSRRLGRSLGINIIPPKTCSYSCIYCQLGQTSNKQIERRLFYEPKEILREVEQKVEQLNDQGDSIDYLAFVPDGEPTLDINLGREIELLKPLGIRIAVITNASLLWDEKVRSELYNADWISVKVDGFSAAVWRKVNSPHSALDHNIILKGINDLAEGYAGEFTTETMLIRGVNDHPGELGKIAYFLTELRPKKAYISIPTRPPAAEWVKPANGEAVNQAYRIFADRSLDVEYLIGFEGNAFASTGDAEADLLSITAVHPMREDSVRELLSTCNEDWGVVEGLIQRGELTRIRYQGANFYLRAFSLGVTGSN